MNGGGGGGVGGQKNGAKHNGFFSLKTFSSYLRIVSSGASSVASTVRSASASVATSITDHYDDSDRDQVHWAGFDKLEYTGDALRQLLLLGYRSGFQVWDVEEAEDVRILASRHDGPVSFLQMLKNPVQSKKAEDKFSDERPLLAVASDSSSRGFNIIDGIAEGPSTNGTFGGYQELGNESVLPTSIYFYSLKTHDYVHVLKFRSPVYAIRCSSRIIAVSQASQIHCFDAATLERDYTILTHPVALGSIASGSIGYGPLAVGPRWLAYSGSPLDIPSAIRVSPEHLNNHSGVPITISNGVAQYAKESSKQLAAGILTLGDMGYKKLTKYCSELLPDGNISLRQGTLSSRANANVNGQLSDAESVGVVIVRDIVSKSLVVQFRAHTSPISALCFDPSGTLLVTASVHGHNINVFQVMPSVAGISSGNVGSGTCVHLYKLQRGLTNAVIQDISFSDDSQWIMISSSRGTSHLFAISPFRGIESFLNNDASIKSNAYMSDMVAKGPSQGSHGSVSPKHLQQNLYASGSPITLSVVSRIRNGSNGWKGAVSGAAAAATGRASYLSGAIASAFHNCKGSNLYQDNSNSRGKYFLLVFSPSGFIVQYLLRQSSGNDSAIDFTGLNSISQPTVGENESKLVIEALQKWDICYKHSRRDRSDSIDVYGEHGHGENLKLFQKGARKGTSIHPSDSYTDSNTKLKIEENHQLYISEVELKMHPHQPVWTKSQFCFQIMLDDKMMMPATDAVGGENEIERIASRIVEIRSKDLIPVFDFLHIPRFQQSRSNTFDSNQNGLFLHQKSGLTDEMGHSTRSNSSSIDMSQTALNGLSNGMDENGSQAPEESVEAFVNSRGQQSSSL